MRHASSRSAKGILVVALALLVASGLRVPMAGPLGTLAGPQVLVLEPNGANGSDTFLLSGTPLWNYGDNSSLFVGPNPVTGALARSSLRFNLASLPSNATIANGTLSLYETQGSGGTIEARRAMGSWTEGTGNHSWTRLPVLVQETAGVNRTLEPVGVTVTFPPGAGIDPPRDLRVWNGSQEVPSQVYGYTYSGGQVTSTQVWFDVTLAARGARWYNITYATNGTAAPAYRTQSWGSSPLWVYGSGGGSSGATVADLFGNGKLEVLFGSADGYVYCVDARGTPVWTQRVSPTGRSVPYSPQVADMNRSGQPSVVVVTDDASVVRLDRNGNIVWRYNSSAVLYTTPTLADVNGDGVLDVLVGGNMKFVDAIDGRDGTLLRQYAVGLAGYTATVGNVSGQSVIFFPGDDKAVHAYTFAGTLLWTGAASGASFLEGSIGLGDVNGDGVPEVVTGDNGNNGILFALNATDGTSLWSNATATYREGGQTLADLNGDGQVEVLFGTKGGMIYTLRGANGYTVWSYPTGVPVYSTPAVSDLDRSGGSELVVIVDTNVLVLNAAGSLIHSWTITANNQNLRSVYEYTMNSPAIADLTGNGTLDVLVPTGSGMAAFQTGGLFHDWRTWGYNQNHTNLAFDGSSPARAPFLQATLGTPQAYPAAGASWNYRDGVTPWAARGGDFGAPEANATGAPGWWSWNVTAMVRAWVANPSTNLGLFLTEAAEISGPFHVFASGDAPAASLRPFLRVEWVYGSPSSSGPRIMGRIPDQVRPENSPPWNLALGSFAQDNSTPLGQLRWNVTGYDPGVLSIYGINSMGNHNLTFASQAGGSGSFHVTYWLTDPAGRYASQTAWVNITLTNLPPVFTPPPVLYVHADQVYPFDFGPYISDPDTPRDRLTFVSSDTVGAPASGFNVSFQYPTSLLDQWVFVNLTVSDGQNAVTRTMSVKVTDDQPPFVRSPLPDETLLQGELRQNAFNLEAAFVSLDGTSLTYSAGSARTEAVIHANGSVDLRAPLGWWGVEGLTFRATDAAGSFAEDTILVTVIHVDAPPVLGPVPDLRVHYAAPFYFNLDPYLSDPDTPLAGLAVTASDAHVAVSGHLLSILYPLAYNNTVQNVTLTVSDGYLTASRLIHVAVGSDWPPQFSKLPDARFLEGTVDRGAYNLSEYFSDPDGSILFWSSGNRSVLVTIHANGSVDLAGRGGWWGTERVTFRATDAAGGLQEDSVWITVLRVDDRPFFRPVPEQRLNVTTAYLPLTPYLGDLDDAVSNLTLLGTNSTRATVAGQGVLFSFPGDAEAWIEVTVSDGNLTNTTTIRVIVSLPPASVQEVIPGWMLWVPLPLAAVAATAFVAYRRRKLEWAFLVTKDGLLVSSVSRRGPGEIDTDLVTGMLTAIMDFAKQSFSDEKERNLEGLEMGDKRVAIVRGDRTYLAVVYRGRTPGRLLAIMQSLLERIEAEHGDALGDIVDTSTLEDIPRLLERLVTRGNLPFVTFGDGQVVPR